MCEGFFLRFPVSVRRAVLVSIFLLLVAVCEASRAQNKSWADYGGSPTNSHYVDLKQITKSNVGKLQIAWTYNSGDEASYLFNPVVEDNVMYVVARNTSLVALDATTGREIWVHTGMQGMALRGINFWRSNDGKDKRLIFQINQQLQEIDAKTGKSIEAFGDRGFVDLKLGLRNDPKNISRVQSNNPGKVFENLIIMGSAPGENFISPPGDVRAFDVITGKLVWQFHTVPRPGERGYESWPKEAWRYAGGVNTWGELSVDDKRGIAYFPLGSATFDFYGADRIGDDLFADCILALDARTGKYLWHFQEVHHDLWDYDPTSAPQLTTIRKDGKTIDVVAQAGKSGFLYVLDRVTGKPIWPMEERPVPASDMPGEVASKTQPFPTAPPAFARQKFTSADINPYLPVSVKEALKSRIDADRNEGLFTPPGMQETVSMPGNRGGSNWGTTAANPTNGSVYVVSVDAPALLKMAKAQPTRAEASAGMNPLGPPEATNPAMDSMPGHAIYQQNCQMCHGPDRTGGGSIPSLVGVTNRLNADVIESTIQNGQGQMPSFASLTSEQIRDLIAFLAAGSGDMLTPRPAVTVATGNIVGKGGTAAGEAQNKAYLSSAPKPYGLMDGPAYPEGSGSVPTERYFTGWNVMYAYEAPPWNTFTAYDLNKGTIKWQVSVGDAPGLLTEQRGVLPTSTGLIFFATGDAKVRAYDADTGKVIWTADLPAGSRGLPSMYEANGKQYLVVNATTSLTIGDGNPADASPARDLHRGYVAFALPDLSQHKK
jgi:quinoprotein glucose dehydrogenase